MVVYRDEKGSLLVQACGLMRAGWFMPIDKAIEWLEAEAAAEAESGQPACGAVELLPALREAKRKFDAGEGVA